MKNVKLNYSGNIKKVRQAVARANIILGSEVFYSQIRAYKTFNSSLLSPEVISDLLQKSGHTIDVKVSWLLPNLKTRKDIICISGWDFSNKIPKAVNQLIYETVNSIDYFYHVSSNNRDVYQPECVTACWVIGTIAEIMTLEPKPVNLSSVS